MSFKKEIKEWLSNKKISLTNTLNQLESSENENKDNIPNEKEKNQNSKKIVFFELEEQQLILLIRKMPIKSIFNSLFKYILLVFQIY